MLMPITESLELHRLRSLIGFLSVQIVQLLKGEGNLEPPKLGRRSTLQRTYSVELLDVEEYNSTRYLNDLNRHRQVAMEF